MKLRWLCPLAAAALLAGCLPAATPMPTPRLPTVSPTATVGPTIQHEPSSTPAATPSPAPPAADLPALAGDLANQVAALEERMPRQNSEGFAVPTGEEKAGFAALAAAIEAGDTREAAKLAAASGYDLLRYVDHGDEGAQSYLLRERKGMRRGWGLYVLRIGPASNVLVEAPHPLYDEGTAQVALAAYRALKARALLIAGAHRDANRDGSADVAHNRQTVFQAIHEALAGETAPVVLQVHGFAAVRHPGYPQVVLGSDQASASSVLQRLSQALAAAGLSAGVCDGTSWKDLCGASNVQSSLMESGIFVHLELTESVRADYYPLLAALQQVLGLAPR